MNWLRNWAFSFVYISFANLLCLSWQALRAFFGIVPCSHYVFFESVPCSQHVLGWVRSVFRLVFRSVFGSIFRSVVIFGLIVAVVRRESVVLRLVIAVVVRELSIFPFISSTVRLSDVAAPASTTVAWVIFPTGSPVWASQPIVVRPASLFLLSPTSHVAQASIALLKAVDVFPTWLVHLAFSISAVPFLAQKAHVTSRYVCLE